MSLCSQVKLFGAPLVCPFSGCETILDSSYSSLFGIPLSLFGMLTYATVASLAAFSAIKQEEGKKADTDNAGERGVGIAGPSKMTDDALLGGVTLLATCSAALM